MFHNLKHCDARFIIQELRKFNFKTNAIPSRLKRYMSFSIGKKLVIINSFEILISSLDSLVKNLGEDDFKDLSQELDIEVLDLVKQK